MQALTKKSPAEMLMEYCSKKNVGVIGKLLHAHRLSSESEGEAILFMDEPRGNLDRLLSGVVSSQVEFVNIQARATKHDRSRELVEKVVKELDNLQNYLASDGTTYMNVLAETPVFLVGLSRNDSPIHMVRFRVRR